jgi:hypothetical protein
MTTHLALWSLVFLCFSMATALGGVLCEHIVLTPRWSTSPASGFPVMRRAGRASLWRFWFPVHLAIAVSILLALFWTWSDIRVRSVLLTGLVSYTIMRLWNGLVFIRELLAFQENPSYSASPAEHSARVAEWTYWTWFRGPLNVVSFLCVLLALYWLKIP